MPGNTTTVFNRVTYIHMIMLFITDSVPEILELMLINKAWHNSIENYCSELWERFIANSTLREHRLYMAAQTRAPTWFLNRTFPMTQVMRPLYGELSLLNAVMNGQHDAVITLIESGANVNYQARHPLARLAIDSDIDSDNVPILSPHLSYLLTGDRFLYRAKAFPNLLGLAISRLDFRMVDILSNNGAKPNTHAFQELIQDCLRSKGTPQLAQVEEITLLLIRKSIIDPNVMLDSKYEFGDGDGMTQCVFTRPLLAHVASKFSANTIQQLIDLGADVNLEGDYGPALFTAIYWARPEIVKLLHKNGADLTHALKIAFKRHFIRMFECSHDVIDFYLIPQEHKKMSEIIIYLLEKNPLDPLCSQHSYTPGKVTDLFNLEWALRTDRSAIALTCFQGLKNLFARTSFGKQAIHIAAIRHDVVSINYLIRRGANINAKDNLGYTPLHHAVNHGHAEIVSILISHGARTDLKDEDGCIPLHWAVSSSEQPDPMIISMLLDSNPNSLYISDHHGKTAFDWTKNPEVLAQLERFSSDHPRDPDPAHQPGLSR